MIYMRCPSCEMLIGNRQIMYEDGLDKINSNPNLKEEDKLLLKIKLIDNLKIKRYCCKMRITTYKELTDIIK